MLSISLRKSCLFQNSRGAIRLAENTTAGAKLYSDKKTHVFTHDKGPPLNRITALSPDWALGSPLPRLPNLRLIPRHLLFLVSFVIALPVR